MSFRRYWEGYQGFEEKQVSVIGRNSGASRRGDCGRSVSDTISSSRNYALQHRRILEFFARRNLGSNSSRGSKQLIKSAHLDAGEVGARALHPRERLSKETIISFYFSLPFLSVRYNSS